MLSRTLGNKCIWVETQGSKSAQPAAVQFLSAFQVCAGRASERLRVFACDFAAKGCGGEGAGAVDRGGCNIHLGWPGRSARHPADTSRAQHERSVTAHQVSGPAKGSGRIFQGAPRRPPRSLSRAPIIDFLASGAPPPHEQQLQAPRSVRAAPDRIRGRATPRELDFFAAVCSAAEFLFFCGRMCEMLTRLLICLIWCVQHQKSRGNGLSLEKCLPGSLRQTLLCKKCQLIDRELVFCIAT